MDGGIFKLSRQIHNRGCSGVFESESLGSTLYECGSFGDGNRPHFAAKVVQNSKLTSRLLSALLTCGTHSFLVDEVGLLEFLHVRLRDFHAVSMVVHALAHVALLHLLLEQQRLRHRDRRLARALRSLCAFFGLVVVERVIVRYVQRESASRDRHAAHSNGSNSPPGTCRYALFAPSFRLPQLRYCFGLWFTHFEWGCDVGSVFTLVHVD